MRATSPVSSGEPTPGTAVFDYCHCEERSDARMHCHCETRLRVVATLGRSPPLRHATRATSPGTAVFDYCHCEERSDAAISREGELPRSEYSLIPGKVNCR